MSETSNSNSNFGAEVSKAIEEQQSADKSGAEQINLLKEKVERLEKQNSTLGRFVEALMEELGRLIEIERLKLPETDKDNQLRLIRGNVGNMQQAMIQELKDLQAESNTE